MKTTRALLGTAAIIAAAAGMTGCTVTNSGAAVPNSFCGYIIGNGEYHDSGPSGNRTINNLLLPGDVVKYNNDYDSVRFFGCGPRNYVIKPKDTGGDSNEPLTVRTSLGTAVNVYATIYWQPNQSTLGGLDNSPLKQFITFCEKYTCSAGSPEDFAKGPNSSTEGWNSMLRENMHPVLQRVAEQAFLNIADDVWINDSRTSKDKAAEIMAANFAAEMQRTNGYTVDLLCGSGQTGRGDQFDCQQVRIVVDRVVAAQGNMQQAADQAAEQKRQTELQQQQADTRIAVTDRLYGPLAPQVRACEDHREAVCVLGAGTVQINK